jgi:hypothetical protein
MYWCCKFIKKIREIQITGLCVHISLSFGATGQYQYICAEITWSVRAKAFSIGKVPPCLQHIPYHIAYQFSWRERNWKYVFFKMTAMQIKKY